ncbi:hypothetical protein OSB04_021004 [Centaurea solstitialis]|uniref:Uncharacterized protein n=1 Tax=Centaurea solstitialis TaxID=347529 RepID=A0AA38T6U7_9ASTR|nr:hypothetical protein OSB04_021004 [Centaurea solstitialis]
MSKGSKNSGNSTTERIMSLSHFAYVSPAPVKTVTVKGGGRGEGSYETETKSQVSYGDKRSGSYGRATTNEKASAGEFQWKNGTSGTKIEYKKSSTVRVGNKSGYTEVYNEQRIRNVSYNNSSSKLVTYSNNDGNDDDYYGYDSDY